LDLARFSFFVKTLYGDFVVIITKFSYLSYDLKNILLFRNWRSNDLHVSTILTTQRLL